MEQYASREWTVKEIVRPFVVTHRCREWRLNVYRRWKAMQRNKTAYIVCPVRRLTDTERTEVLSYVAALEAKGYQVRCPFRDTDQNGDGLSIVEAHEADIMWADEIHIWWNPASEGSLWDVAQARMARHFQLEKRIVLINAKDVRPTAEKSYTNVVLRTP